MTDRIAIVDEHIVDQDPAYVSSRPTWVTGATQTLLMTRARSTSDMIQWVRTRGTASRRVDLDLLCHGSRGTLAGGGAVYVLRLGLPGIYEVNVDQWNQVAGRVRKIRVYACGVLSPEHDGAFDPTRDTFMQHSLMKRLARATGVTVKYSLQTAEFGMSVRSTGSQSLTADQMQSPIYIADPSGGSRLVR
jgi:hypothetical protein